jgi:hypothetical protein
MGACVAGTVYGSWQLVTEKQAHVVAVEQAKYHLAVDRLDSRAGHALHLIAEADASLVSAQQSLEGSAGKTLDEAARIELETEIRKDRFSVGVAREEIRQTDASVKTPKVTFWAPDYAPAAAKLDERVFVSASHLTSVPSRVNTATKKVAAAVDAWQKEQERIAAERKRQEEEAAARAAAEAAARAAAARPTRSSSGGASGSSGGSSSGGVSSVYTEYVGSYGWQPEIDSCNGAVDISSHYGIHTIARHNYCGGTAFPKYAGAIVQLTGVEGGLYRVIGVVANLNGHVNTTADLPRGYDLLYQTCVNGYSNMSFTALEKIG